jgi:GTP cyclohydrolase IA
MSVDRPAAERAIADFLRALGHDPAKEAELGQTPALVAAAYADELLAGYRVDLRALLADGSPVRDSGIVVIDQIGVTAVCPHHLLPAIGRATVAYRPGQRVLGLGTVARLVDACGRRLVLQEQIAHDVVGALVELGGARGAFCRVTLRHGCLSARGARENEAAVVTQAAAGDLALPAASGELELALGGTSAK